VSFGSLRGLVLGIGQDVLGVPATITRPAPLNTPIATTAIWLVEPVSDGQPYGTDFRRGAPRKVLVIAKADVPECPDRGTVIVAPEVAGESNKTWLVDGTDRVLADQWRVIVKLQN
jgi:hypothetical protein